MLGFHVAPSATAPAAPVVPARPVGAAILRFLFWTALLKPVGQALILTFHCLYWLTNQTWQGRYRYHLRPVWVGLAAACPFPGSPLTWVAVAAPFALTRRDPKRWISALEQRYIGWGLAVAAAWNAGAASLWAVDWRLAATAYSLALTAAALPWWRSRDWRDAPEPVDEIHPLVEAWEWQVACHDKAGPLAGTVLCHDPATGRFHLRAPIDGPEGVEKADLLACRLMSRPRGTVTISIDPDGDANDFLIAFTDRADGTVVRYADGPSLDSDGTIAIADTADGRTIRVALYTTAGAAHVLILATNRYGKGVIMRALGVELCLWDKAFLVVIDAKGDDDGGAGIPELRGHADVYARTKTQWKAAIHMEHELFQARSRRYGLKGVAFWHPDKPVDGYCDPLIAGMKDELRNIRKAIGQREIGMLEQLSSMGATYGMGQVGNTQKGDAESVFSTAWRNDIRGNGSVFAGRAGDAQAAGIAAQDFAVDLNRLPNGKGWWIIKTALTDVPLVPARGRMYPTRDELEYQKGIATPFGTVEDWLTMTKRAKLHPEDQEIIERWRPEFDDAVLLEPQPAPEPVRESVEVAAGVIVEAPRLHLVPAQTAGARTARELIPDVLRTAGRALTRGEIADRIGQSPTYVSGLLNDMEGKAVKRAKTPNGKPGWTVAA